jgi:hypothetical protein
MGRKLLVKEVDSFTETRRVERTIVFYYAHQTFLCKIVAGEKLYLSCVVKSKGFHHAHYDTDYSQLFLLMMNSIRFEVHRSNQEQQPGLACFMHHARVSHIPLLFHGTKIKLISQMNYKY